MDSIITVNNISFFYKNLQALKDISFLVNPGDFIALMGVNGAGKSTLLNILHGTLSPYQGEVYFNDKKFQVDEVYEKTSTDIYDILITNDNHKYSYVIGNQYNKQKKIIK